VIAGENAEGVVQGVSHTRYGLGECNVHSAAVAGDEFQYDGRRCYRLSGAGQLLQQAAEHLLT